VVVLAGKARQASWGDTAGLAEGTAGVGRRPERRDPHHPEGCRKDWGRRHPAGTGTGRQGTGTDRPAAGRPNIRPAHRDSFRRDPDRRDRREEPSLVNHPYSHRSCPRRQPRNRVIAIMCAKPTNRHVRRVYSPGLVVRFDIGHRQHVEAPVQLLDRQLVADQATVDDRLANGLAFLERLFGYRGGLLVADDPVQRRHD
jgi:hypothetical protein